MITPLFILGSTAVGKSDIGLILAGRMQGELCAVDAYQIYRGMDIGTGKASQKEQDKIPHRLIDLVEPEEEFSVADYAGRAEAVKRDLEGRNLPSVWVGGTGLYYRALREGLSPAPATEAAVLRELQEIPFLQLQEEIRRVDPKWAAEADLSNPRRVLRALAVFRQTGRTMSSWHEEKTAPCLPEAKAFLLVRNREVLRKRIEKRVEGMWRQGWPEEVRGLLERPGWEGSQSFKALGYKEVAACLRGEMGPEACREAIVLQTHQYAKRQLTWFRRESNLQVIEWNDSDSGESVASRLQKHLGAPPSSR